MIERSAERGGRLADQLLAFARNQILQPQSISAYGALCKYMNCLDRRLGRPCRFVCWRTKISGIAMLIRVNSTWPILNLVLNSRDAMPAGGHITISCHNQSLSDDQLRNRSGSAGDYVRIDVKDTGTGIPADLLPRVFEPFFTSKPVGKGSGLGLAQVHGFAGQSGGWVDLESQAGLGTTVSIYLPRAEQPEIDPAAEVQYPARELRATILAVEPQSELRTTICEALAQANYRVLEATSASGALAYLVSDEFIQVILAEFRLPGAVTGISLITRCPSHPTGYPCHVDLSGRRCRAFGGRYRG